MLFILGILFMIGSPLILNFNGHGDVGWILYGFSLTSGFVIYIFASFLAVCLFVKNLQALVLLRVNSQRDVTTLPEAVDLSVQQQKVIDLSAKYVLLFVVAILST